MNNNLALKQQLIGLNGLNINQINTLQSSLYSKIASNLVYTKLESDANYYTKSAIDSLLLLEANQLTTYSEIENDSLLALKQNVIAINGLNINQINTLQASLDLKQNVIAINGLNINQINNLQASLDAKMASNLVYSKIESDTNYYNKLAIDNLLSLEQNVIAINGLNINQVNLLQTSLDSKQNVIGLNSLNINQINALQTSLDSKIATTLVYTKVEMDNLLLLEQNVIGLNGLNINQVNLLQISLDS